MVNNTYSPSAIFDPGELRAQFIGINIPFVQISYIFLKISQVLILMRAQQRSEWMKVAVKPEGEDARAYQIKDNIKDWIFDISESLCRRN